MRRAHIGLVVAATVAALVAGCGSEPSQSVTSNGPPPPTAPVGADGKPITSLCDLLTVADFSELTGQPATAPTPVPASANQAVCNYGGSLRMSVLVGGTVSDATAAYQSTLKTVGFVEVKPGAIGGVDESSYGTAQGLGLLNVRRLKLVVSISVPGSSGEVQLVQLAGRVLSRANALGT